MLKGFPFSTFTQLPSDNYGLLDSNTKKAAISFIPRASGSVTKITLKGYRNNASPTYRIGIQADAAGSPSGSFLNYTDFTWTSSSNGFQTITITSTALTAATKYWIVLQYVSGTVNSSNCFIYDNISDQETRWCYDMVESGIKFFIADPAWAEVSADNPVFSVDNASTYFTAQPYDTVAAAMVLAAVQAGEKITATEDCILNTISTMIRNDSGATADLIYEVRLASNKSLVCTGTFCTNAQITTSYQKITATVAAHPQLTAGTAYYIIFKTASTGNYHEYRLPIFASSLGAAAAESYQGAGSCYILSADSGANITETTTKDLWFDWTLSAPPPPILVSPNKNAYSGFHCFIEQAINNFKRAGSACKNPNNGEFF